MQGIEAYISESTCPYCKKIVTIAHAGTPRVAIHLCTECNTVWYEWSRNGSKEPTTGRLIYRKVTNLEPKDFRLCPICWDELVPDYIKNEAICPDPICHYSKRIPGLSKAQKDTLKKFETLKLETFKQLETNPNYELPKEYIELRTAVKRIHAWEDEMRLREKERKEEYG